MKITAVVYEQNFKGYQIVDCVVRSKSFFYFVLREDCTQGNEGFEDIDGFNINDIYCVGGRGDVWHSDGMKWKQTHFPSNLDLYTVCCAGDGYVYISGYGGTTFKGRGDQWKQIYKGR